MFARKFLAIDRAARHDAEIMSRHLIAVLFASVMGFCCGSTTPGVAQEKPGVGPRTLWMDSFYRNRDVDYGRMPPAWVDLRPSAVGPGWIVDGQGRLRYTQKGRTGLIVYEGGTRTGDWIGGLEDGVVSAMFSKTADDGVSMGIAVRIVDANNYYLARLRGDDRIELLKVVDGREIPLNTVETADGSPPRDPGLTTLSRYQYPDVWGMKLTFVGEEITVAIQSYLRGDMNQGRITARDKQFTKGRVGFCCTPFAAVHSVHIDLPSDIPKTKRLTATTFIEASNRRRHQERFAGEPESVIHPVVKPVTFDPPGVEKPGYTRWSPPSNEAPPPTWSLPPERIAEHYDVVVAGAGCGGWAATVQAARLGARVLLLEETDWIGGQMACAGVTSMDEDGVRGTYAVRERGLYREFNESMTAFYHTRDKDPLVAYYGWPEQREGGYEPKVVRGVLYGFIQEARLRGSVLDVVLQARITEVRKEGNQVVGAKLEAYERDDFDGKWKPTEREVRCRVLIDATEYGDVIPLTGARYRVGNTTNDKPDPKALVQDHTWTAVVREYPDGVPDAVKLYQLEPPGYDDYAGKRFRKYRNDGPIIWGAAGKGIKGARSWRSYFAWRGMADSDSDLVGLMSSQRHTQCGFNGGNDYPVTVATIEDRKQRLLDEREGIYRTLGTLYYFQQELGVPWSLASDEEFDTPYNRRKMLELNLASGLEKLAVHLPQQPYVRECRRIIGVKTLVATDLGRYENQKLWPTSIAMGDYFMDLDHGKTAHAIEADLDGAATEAGTIPHGGGPFQVPLETLIPETIDGFLAAEKNISQSRLVNGATRLQPITMLTGQAAGVVAALAARKRIQPREVRPVEVQSLLLDAGSTLVQRWYSNVPWRSHRWKDVQLATLLGIHDQPMQIDDDPATPLGAEAKFDFDRPVTPAELNRALLRIAELRGVPKVELEIDADAAVISRDAANEAARKAYPRWSDMLSGLLGPFENDKVVPAGKFIEACIHLLLLPLGRETDTERF